MQEGYWARHAGRATSRRQLLRGVAFSAAGLAGAALIGCGGGADKPAANATPAGSAAAGSAAKPQPKAGGSVVFTHAGTIPNLDTHTQISPVLSGGVAGLVTNRLLRHASD